MAAGRPSVLFAEGRCVGGSTVVNGGMSWRTPARVLDRWSAEGVLAIGEREMEPYFARAESRHSVGSQDPETIGRDSELMRAGAVARGWAVVPNRRTQLHCAGTNSCTSGCPTGAKRSMLVTSVPRALALGARLYADCRVDRITRKAGAVTGLAGHFLRPGDPKSPKLTVRARTVVVAGGAIQTPALLARSGLHRGQLGRNLSLHPNTTGVAFFDSEVTGWHGVHQAFQVLQLGRLGGEGYLHTSGARVHQVDALDAARRRRIGVAEQLQGRAIAPAALLQQLRSGRSSCQHDVAALHGPCA